MFEFHIDRKRYFDMQLQNAAQYVIPFIENKFAVKRNMRVLEIGCGEGGVLKAFIDKGCIGVGVELDEPRLVSAQKWLKQEIESGQIVFISKDIYHVLPEKELGGLFDIIILKDVIEHVHNHAKLISWMKDFLQPGGVIYFGFPPWQMPFGGHQQIIKHRWLSKMPYYHLLPKKIYKWILKKYDAPVDALLEVRETKISIEKFEKIAKSTGYKIIYKTHYLINPIYKYKFGWKPRKQVGFISKLPWIRNFFTTCVYYLITPIK